MNKNHHREICEQLSAKWQEDKFRRQQELNKIGRPDLVDRLFPWLFTAGCLLGIYIVLHYAQ